MIEVECRETSRTIVVLTFPDIVEFGVEVESSVRAIAGI